MIAFRKLCLDFPGFSDKPRLVPLRATCRLFLRFVFRAAHLSYLVLLTGPGKVAVIARGVHFSP